MTEHRTLFFTKNRKNVCVLGVHLNDNDVLGAWKQTFEKVYDFENYMLSSLFKL